MKSKKKSIVLAACAITNAQNVNASASNSNKHLVTPYNSFNADYIESTLGSAFLVRGGSHEEAPTFSTSDEKQDRRSSSGSSSKRKKKKKRKNKSTAADVKVDNGENSEQSRPKHQEKCAKEESSAGATASDDKSKSTSKKQSSKTESDQSAERERVTSEQNQEEEPISRNDECDPIEEIINSTCLYQILSLDSSQKSTLTAIQITKAYRRRAVKTHPDKLNGDRRAFDKVSEAYDVLSDESKKKIYDKFGLEAVKDPDFIARAGSRGMGVGNAFSGVQEEILRGFFGAGAKASGSFSRMSSHIRKNKDVKYELEISLEDMYRGAANRGVYISQPNGPKEVYVDIPAGIVQGSSIRLSGVVDHVASATPADVVFIVRQRGHSVFTRKGHDLAIEVKLSLSEALCGFHRQITHLDGRKVHITGPMRTSTYNDNVRAPSVIQTGDVHVLKGEGMPKQGRQPLVKEEEPEEDAEDRCERYGDLYVQYTVETPRATEANMSKLSPDERKTLGDLLEKLQGTTKAEKAQDHISTPRPLKNARASDFGRASGIANPQNDDDHMYTEENYHTGGGQGFQYFSSMGGSRSHFFSRGSSPFTRSSASFGADEDSDVQCQQM